MAQPVKKAIFPVAGLGTRFLPATKATPKEMLPIIDKPLIQYAVEEAVAAGITEMIFVTSYSKRAIEDHFDSNYELESKLEMRGKYELLAIVQDILPDGVSCAYVRQPNQLGLGHAVLCTLPLIGKEPFAVLLADDLIHGGEQYCLQQMMTVFNDTHSSVVAAQQVAPEETEKYGIIALDQTDTQRMRMQHIVEKPKPEVAPSTLAAVGRYILTPAIFEHLKKTQAGAGGEIQLTDAIGSLLSEQAVYAHPFTGKRYDCGSKLGYLEATIELGMQHPEVGERFRQYLGELGLSTEKVS